MIRHGALVETAEQKVARDLGITAPYQPHSPESRAAAADLSSSKLGALQLRVLEEIHRTGGSTDEEIAHALGMNPSTARPRRIELERRGLIRKAGHGRRTSSGRQAAVWEPVP